MNFDYKKEFKDFYQPKKTPSIVTIPPMNFVTVHGQGNPEVEDGEYKKALNLLYAISYTIRMSKKGGHDIDGYFEYVVPPLEGLWWQPQSETFDPLDKESLQWISMIRLPDFVTSGVFEWAKREVSRKKNLDVSKAEFFSYDEGLCMQCLHVGSYDSEPSTIAVMNQAAKEAGCEPELSGPRYHHEIYLSDPRRTKPERLKTVIRHPLKKSVKE